MSPPYTRLDSSAVKVRSSRSGTIWSDGWGTVGRTRRRSRIPAILASASTRATRLWFTRSSAGAPSLSSAVTRGTRRPGCSGARRAPPGSAPRAADQPRRGQPGPQRRRPTRSTTTGRSQRSGTTASPRRRSGGRRRTGSGSPARLPGEILGRRPEDVPLTVELPRVSLQLADSSAQAGEFLLGRLAIRWRARPATRPPVHLHAGGLQPRRQCPVHDPQVRGDAHHRRPRRRPVQLHRVPAKLLRVRLPCHRLIFSLPPGPAWVERVQDRGSSPPHRENPRPLDPRRAGHRKTPRAAAYCLPRTDLWLRFITRNGEQSSEV